MLIVEEEILLIVIESISETVPGRKSDIDFLPLILAGMARMDSTAIRKEKIEFCSFRKKLLDRKPKIREIVQLYHN